MHLSFVSHIARTEKAFIEFSAWFETSWPGMNMNAEGVSSVIADHVKRPCGCMPDCTLYRYPVEGSLGVIDRKNSYSDSIFLQVSLRYDCKIEVTRERSVIEDFVGTGKT